MASRARLVLAAIAGIALARAGLACGFYAAAENATTDAGDESSTDGSEPAGEGGPVGADASTSTGSLRFSVDPGSVELRANGSATIRVVLERPATAAVQIAVNDLGPGASAAPLTILAGATEGTFALSIADKPRYGLSPLAVVATSGEASGIAPLALRVVGEQIYTVPGTTPFEVPAGVSNLSVKAWGAGGGGGAAAPALGGAGGFAACNLAVTAGETLSIIVGSGGKGGAPIFTLIAGGGGGFSAVHRAPTYMIIAGGGGGGGRNGKAGGAGGGVDGVTGEGDDAYEGLGGSSTSVGAGGQGDLSGTPGSGVVGGHGAGTESNGNAGGVPGGGRSGYILNGTTVSAGGGGGGGGRFGGGGGATQESPSKGGGGGGGSGLANCASPTLAAGNGAVPAQKSDPDYGADAGASGDAGASSGAGGGGAVGNDGKPGRVVLRFGFD